MQAVSSVVTAELHFYCQHFDHDFDENCGIFVKSAAPVGIDCSPSARCQLRLAQQGNGPVQKVVVGLFVHMLARAGQRGSRRR